MLAVEVLRQLTSRHTTAPSRPGPWAAGIPPQCLEASRAYIRLTEVYWFANDVPALVHAGIRALNLAERAGPSPELARAYAIICLASGSIPSTRSPGVRPPSRANGPPSRPTVAAGLRALHHQRLPHRCRSLAAGAGGARGGRGSVRATGDRRLLGDTWSVQGLLALYRGQFDPAGAAFAKLYERGSRNENVQHQVWACIGWAECQLRAGRTGEAARLLETALRLLTEHPDHAEQVRAYGLLAVVQWHQGEETAARVAASSAASLIAHFKRPTSFYLLEGYAGVAEVYLDQWEAGDRSLPTRRAARRACSACVPSRVCSQSASPAPACGAAASTTLGPAGPGTASLAGKPRRRPTARHALRGRPRTFNSVGLLTVSRSDNGTLSKRTRCWTNWESPTLIHCIHPQDRHTPQQVRPGSHGERVATTAIAELYPRPSGGTQVVPNGHLDSCPAPQAADGQSVDGSGPVRLLLVFPSRPAYGRASAVVSCSRRLVLELGQGLL